MTVFEYLGRQPTPNPYIYNQFVSAKKRRAFCGLLKEEYYDLLKDDETKAYDINKCYTSIMYKRLFFVQPKCCTSCYMT